MSDHKVSISFALPEDAKVDAMAIITADWVLPSGITIGQLIKYAAAEIELALVRYHTKQWVSERVQKQATELVIIEHVFDPDAQKVSATVVFADPKDAMLFKLSHGGE